MLLCDIGNTFFTFYKQGEVTKQLVDGFDIESIDEKVFYICVNPKVTPLLQENDLWIDLAKDIALEGSYETLGIDRKVAISAISGGVVVDAGSAITVDVIENSHYQGGFIYPGFVAMQKAFAEISSKLDYLLNFEVSLDKIAKNSQDAISYGSFMPLITEIKRLSEGKKLIVTGGDGEFLAKHLEGSLYEPHWLFDAMKTIIDAKGYTC